MRSVVGSWEIGVERVGDKETRDKKQVKAKKHAIIIILIATLVVVSFGMSAQAGVMIFGDGPLGDFEGSFTYNAINSNNGSITFILKNTSPVSNGGYLTAFAFNNPSNLINAVTLNTTDPHFSLLGNSIYQNGIKCAPYGYFDIGASSTRNSFEGGGNPAGGMPVGLTETFIFDLQGTGLDTLNEQSFISTLSEGKGAGSGEEFFLARFRGFNDGGSNKTTGSITPEPASLSLLGLGLIALLKIGGKRRSK